MFDVGGALFMAQKIYNTECWGKFFLKGGAGKMVDWTKFVTLVPDKVQFW